MLINQYEYDDMDREDMEADLREMELEMAYEEREAQWWRQASPEEKRYRTLWDEWSLARYRGDMVTAEELWAQMDALCPPQDEGGYMMFAFSGTETPKFLGIAKADKAKKE